MWGSVDSEGDKGDSGRWVEGEGWMGASSQGRDSNHVMCDTALSSDTLKHFPVPGTQAPSTGPLRPLWGVLVYPISKVETPRHRLLTARSWKTLGFWGPLKGFSGSSAES